VPQFEHLNSLQRTKASFRCHTEIYSPQRHKEHEDRILKEKYRFPISPVIRIPGTAIKSLPSNLGVLCVFVVKFSVRRADCFSGA
jgi:hypothetical protein